MYLDRLEDEKKHVEDMSSLHLRTIEALALAIEAKDQTTHGHLQRVEIYALEIGKELGLDEKELEALRAASLLHDVGKLAVPEHIISKPGRLTPEEFDKMKIHPVVGAEILECVQFPYPVVPIVRSHHEKWDGSGYPDGLAGEEIPIGARILSAVDCFDALSSDRQYRRALPQAAAMQVVLAESGRSFDPKVVAVLERRYEDLESRAQDSATTANRLSINVRVTRGDAPAAGFETTAAVDQGGAADFLTSIANAHEEAQGLFELTQEIGNSLSLDETLSVLALRLRRMVPHDCLAVYMIREGKLVPEFINGENSRLFASLEIPLGHGLSGWVAENRMPIVNGNPSVEPGYLNDRTKFSTLGSALAVPLEGLNGVIGTLALYHAGHNAFSKDHLRVLQAIVGKLALSVENAMKYRQAEKSATTDGLTGLPNARSLFLHLDSELSRCHRQSQPLSILVCDLDGFKQVNDRFGHLEGNRILQKVAAGFQEACRSYDYVARMGGDEFVVLLPGQAADQLAKKIERLREIAVRAGREVCGEDILDLSIGEAGYPGDGSSAEQLLAEADRRMYHNKHQNKALLRQGIIDRDFQAPVLVQ
jgi:diguanylate cyclase (GGDEF)-like protein/putative nucleotidyltransferase with HDIG domain